MSRLESFPAATRPLMGIGGATLVRTSVGLRRAENVRPGDLLVTRDSNLQPVRLVIRTDLAAAVAASPENAALRIAPRALGPGTPSAPVVVAPDQNLLLPGFMVREMGAGRGALIPARALGGTTDSVFADRTHDLQPVFAFTFDRHEIISAAGLWIESFRPAVETLGRLDDDLRDRLLRRYPSLRDKRDPFPHCQYDALGAEAYLPQPN